MSVYNEWAAILISLVTAGYLAYSKIVEARSGAKLAGEYADAVQAEALAETAETAKFFMVTARAQVDQNYAEIVAMRLEIKDLRQEMNSMSSEIAALRAENELLREINEWFRSQIGPRIQAGDTK